MKTLPFVLLSLLPALAFADPPPAPAPLPILTGRPDAEAPSLLGPPFESQPAGIAFKPPAGSKEIHRADPDEIVEFNNDQKNWSLKVSINSLSRPTPLTKYTEKEIEKPGLLEMTANNIKQNNEASEILRQDVTNIAANQVGMLAIRALIGGQHKLVQEAIIQASDQQYYVLTFTTPGSSQPASDTTQDPREKQAVQTFSAVLDTVQLLDRSSIKEDQDQRLFHTRGLLTNITAAKLKSILIPQQWLRLIHDGKDIGYTYIVEEIAKDGAYQGVKIGVRSRTVPQPGMQVDAESWLFCTYDRRHETWTNVVQINTAQQKKDYSTEIGYSDMEDIRTIDKSAPIDPKNPKQLPIRTTQLYTLNVTHLTKSSNSPPIKRDLPPFYLPAAIGQLLPRLLPSTARSNGYMFASYVSDRGEVMSRYVDVGPETDVTLAGRSVRAIPIHDRIGLQGSITTHYVTPDGKYLGSVNQDSHIVLLASDPETLRKLWPNPDLTRPAPPATSPSSNNHPLPETK